MSYQVLARKWRPRAFADVVGQRHVLKALVNALDSERLHHAYLFTGTRGVGKTTLARIFAKALNCEQGISAEPCGQCASCKEMDEGRFIDLIEVDAASRTKVEDTRELLDNVQYAPSRGRYKVYLIDEVHMLSKSSFNALLKTLEEPPPNIVFLLATTDPQKVPVTVLSRCLQFNLRRLSPELIQNHLKVVLDRESIPADDNSLLEIARSADGSMRDALSLLDQGIAYGGGRLEKDDIRQMLGTIDDSSLDMILRGLAVGDGGAVIEGVEQVAECVESFSGDFARLLDDVLTVLHRISMTQTVPESLSKGDQFYDLIHDLAEAMTPATVQLYYQIGLIGRRDLHLSPTPRMGIEMTLLRMLAYRLDDVVAGKPSRRVNKKTEVRPNKPASVEQDSPSRSLSGEVVSSRVDIPAETDSPGDIPDNSVASDWHVMSAGLKINGMAKMLASHCVLDSVTGDDIVLRLDSHHAHLLNPPLKQRLEEALRDALGKERCRLDILVGSLSEGETPASRQKRESDERNTQAEKEILEDQGVRNLKDVFNARIVSGSVRPLDGQAG